MPKNIEMIVGMLLSCRISADGFDSSSETSNMSCQCNLGLAGIDGLMADSYTSYLSYPKTLGGKSDLVPAYRSSEQTQA